MTFRFSRTQLLILLGTYLLLGLLLLYFYFSVLAALQQERDTIKSEIRLYNASAKKSSQPSADAELDSLQRQVPLKPLSEQYVLDLEKAEAASGVTITAVALQENTAQEDAAQQGTALSQTAWNIEVRYEAYEQLEAFLKEIESLMRISVVKGMEFKGRDEVLSAGEKKDPFTCSLLVTTYYMSNVPNADELTPDIAVPPLCENRSNPLKPQICK